MKNFVSYFRKRSFAVVMWASGVRVEGGRVEIRPRDTRRHEFLCGSDLCLQQVRARPDCLNRRKNAVWLSSRRPFILTWVVTPLMLCAIIVLCCANCGKYNYLYVIHVRIIANLNFRGLKARVLPRALRLSLTLTANLADSVSIPAAPFCPIFDVRNYRFLRWCP